jgi:non-specific serine/threonine protein kinase
MEWRIVLLGELRATSPSWSVVSRFRTQKAAGLLGFLAYHLERAHPREVLIEVLWPDAEPDSGRNNLSRELSSLRHQLEPPGVRAGSVLVATPRTIQLNPETVTTDVAELRMALEVASRSPTSERTQALKSAVELYKGELLPGFYQDWIANERERLRVSFVRAAREVAAALERAGDPRGAIDYVRRALRTEPTVSEELTRELMALHLAAGEAERALELYERLVRDLQHEHGVAPSTATRELGGKIADLRKPSSVRDKLARIRADRSGPPMRPAPRRPRALAELMALLVVEAEAGVELEELRAVVSKHEGDTRDLPGGLLGTFTRPSQALACALALRERRPGVPVALDAGEVEQDLQGFVVERAEALRVAARAGQLLCSEEAAALLRRDAETSALALVDHGRFHLQGVSSPQRVFEVHSRGEAARTPTADRASASLPLELTRFFGREEERRILEDELRPGGRRLVTIVGPGGMGKTRLAIEALTKAVASYQGNAWFVPLGDLSKGRRVVEAVADALKLDMVSLVEPLERIVAHLSRGPALLVLDNVEHLLEESAACARELLERTGGLSLLVTSRQRLGIEGERELPLAPLAVASVDTPEELVRCASVQVFVDRTQAVKPDFQVTSTNAAHVGELVRFLEGIPLAITLAASHAALLAPEEILGRFRDRLHAAGRSRDLPARHRTLGAAIEGSHALLSPELQQLFARLSVFRDGFTLEAVEIVCEEPLALDRLADLRERSLVATTGERPIRFRMLEAIREYALERLAPEELPELRRRHARYFGELAAKAAPALRGKDEPLWLDRLAAEHENLRAAIEASRDPEIAEVGLGIVVELANFFEVRRPLHESRQLLEQALDASPAPSVLRARALLTAGLVLRREGDLVGARARLESALALARELGQPRGVAASLINLSLLLVRSDANAAWAKGEEGVTVARSIGDPVFEAHAVFNLAVLAQARSEHDVATKLLGDCLATFRARGDQLSTAKALVMLGISEDALGRESEGRSPSRGPAGEAPESRGARARQHAEEARETFASLGYETGVGVAGNLLGNLEESAGAFSLAREHYERSHAIFRRTGATLELAESLRNLARVSMKEGSLALARGHLDELAASGEQDRLGTAELLRAEGEWQRLSGRLAAARDHYERALAIFESAGARGAVAACRDTLKAIASQDSAPRKSL